MSCTLCFNMGGIRSSEICSGISELKNVKDKPSDVKVKKTSVYLSAKIEYLLIKLLLGHLLVTPKGIV